MSRLRRTMAGTLAALLLATTTAALAADCPCAQRTELERIAPDPDHAESHCPDDAAPRDHAAAVTSCCDALEDAALPGRGAEQPSKRLDAGSVVAVVPHAPVMPALLQTAFIAALRDTGPPVPKASIYLRCCRFLE